MLYNYTLTQQDYSSIGRAIINYYKSVKPGMYRNEISIADTRKILKSIIGIRNTNNMSDLMVSDIIINIEDKYETEGIIKLHKNCKMYTVMQ